MDRFHTHVGKLVRNVKVGIADDLVILYSACEMGFFEEIIFKEKGIAKFIQAVDKPALKVSTINPFSCDAIINDEIKKIKSDINEA